MHLLGRPNTFHAEALAEMLRGVAVVSGFSSANSCGAEPALLELLINRVALPKVAALLDSTNFACTHAILRGEGCSLGTVVAGGEALAAIDRDLEMRPTPLIAVEVAWGESVIKRPSPLNVLKDIHDHSCY